MWQHCLVVHWRQTNIKISWDFGTLFTSLHAWNTSQLQEVHIKHRSDYLPSVSVFLLTFKTLNWKKEIDFFICKKFNVFYIYFFVICVFFICVSLFVSVKFPYSCSINWNTSWREQLWSMTGLSLPLFYDNQKGLIYIYTFAPATTPSTRRPRTFKGPYLLQVCVSTDRIVFFVF